MQVISFEITRWLLEGKNVQVTELGPYSEVVAETCNYMRSSLEGTSYVIRVSMDTEVHEVQMDELEQTLRELPRGFGFLVAVELVRPDGTVEKTVRIERVTRRPMTWSDYRFWMNHLHGTNLPEERAREERPEEEEESEEEREQDEWTRGGGQACDHCIDVCRCMSRGRGYDSD